MARVMARSILGFRHGLHLPLASSGAGHLASTTVGRLADSAAQLSIYEPQSSVTRLCQMMLLHPLGLSGAISIGEGPPSRVIHPSVFSSI